MSEACSHDCSSCGSDCAERAVPQNTRNDNNKNIKKVIAVVSGKGGVGKSLVTSMLAVKSRREGLKTAVLDADITGPSIPKSFGLSGKATCNETGTVIYPPETKTGIKTMSLNYLLDNETDPVIWRGPVIASAVKQFWEDVDWEDIDCMFIDCPPGTGDVPLTVFQTLPVDGIVIVTSPQELVNMIVKKAYNMAGLMHVPVLGIVENFSYLKCPDCGREIKLFGESNIDETAKELGVEVLGKLPLDTSYAQTADKGEFYTIDNNYLDKAVEVLKNI